MKNILKFIVNKLFLINLKASKKLSRNNLEFFLLSDLNEITKKKKNSNVLFVGSGGPLEEFVRQNFQFNLVTIDIDDKRKPDFVISISDFKF